jgi:hypothetical protein
LGALAAGLLPARPRTGAGAARTEIEIGRIRAQPVVPLAHVLMGAGDEAALYVAEATERNRARTEMMGIFDQLIQALTA